MKKKFSFSQMLNDNRVILVLSVAIACVSWLLVGVSAEDATLTQIDGIPIDTEMAGSTPASYNLSLIEGGNQTVSVWVEGSRAVIGNLKKTDFVATPDWTSVTTPGEHDVKLNVRVIDTEAGYKITDAPKTVKLKFDLLEEKQLEIIPAADKVKAAEGFRKDVVTATPQTILLRGPQAELDLVTKCTVEYSGDETSENTVIVENGNLVFYTADGTKLTQKQIPHVTYPQQNYSITIPIYMQKTLPVKVSFINNVGKLDISRLKYTLSNPTLTIAGSKDVVSGRDSITVGPIDFTKIDVGSVFMLDVALDTSLLNEDGVKQIAVTFSSDDYDKTTLNIAGGQDGNLLLTNLPADMEAEILTQSVKNVKMVGLKGDIAELEAEELIARADLSNKEEGTSRVRISIQATGNKYVWAVGEYYAEVKLTKKAVEE